MKKAMIVTAIMSIMVTFAGCGSMNENNTNNGAITTKAVVSETAETEEAASQAEEETEAEKSEGEKTDAEKSESEKNDTNSKSEGKKPSNKKSDKETSDDVKDSAAKNSESSSSEGESKKAASADVSAIAGEWGEYGAVTTRFLTVNRDGTFVLKSDSGSVMASGTISVEESEGGKLYSFIDDERGLWYVPFVNVTIDGLERLQTDENPVYDTVTFIRNTGDPGMYWEHTDGIEPIVGTWYEDDIAVGRIINVYEDGSYIADLRIGTSSEGIVEMELTDSGTYYSFYDKDRGFWNRFEVMGEGADQIFHIVDSDIEPSVTFRRSPTTDSEYSSIDKIAGTWYPNDPAMEFTLTVYNDYSYVINNFDGSTIEGIISIDVVDGVEKYSFINDIQGLWYVPFELRTAGQQVVLITEDNPVYEPVSFSR